MNLWLYITHVIEHSDGAEVSRLSEGHCNNGRAAERWNNIGALAGGGGLMSSITDMTRFIRGHLGGGPADVVANLAATRLKVAGSTVKGDGLGWKFRAIRGVKGLFYTNYADPAAMPNSRSAARVEPGFGGLLGLFTGTGVGIVRTGAAAFVDLPWTSTTVVVHRERHRACVD